MKLTYINLLNGYYNSPAFSVSSLSCHSLIMGLLKKANSVGFRESFTATNHEMQHLSKIEAASTFFRIRNEMTSLELDQKKPFAYKNGKKGSSCGEYRIRYDVLLSYSQFFQNNESEMGELPDDSQNFEKNGGEMGTLIDKIREDSKDQTDYPIDGYIPGGKKLTGSLKGLSKEEIDFLWEGYEYYGYSRMKYDNELTRYGYDHMKECLDARIDQEEKGKQPDDPLAYMASIVRNKWMEKSNG